MGHQSFAGLFDAIQRRFDGKLHGNRMISE
jgi:hypothetical protein